MFSLKKKRERFVLILQIMIILWEFKSCHGIHVFFNTPLNSKEKGIMEKWLFFVVSLCCLTRFQHACFIPRVRNLKTHKNVLSLHVSAKVRIVLVISIQSFLSVIFYLGSLLRGTGEGGRSWCHVLVHSGCLLMLQVASQSHLINHTITVLMKQITVIVNLLLNNSWECFSPELDCSFFRHKYLIL